MATSRSPSGPSSGPPSRRDTVAEAITASRVLLSRYLAGFDDTNHTRQAPSLPNHCAWVLGHCALTLRRAQERITHEPPPDSDFVTPDPDLPALGVLGAIREPGLVLPPPSRFDTETVAFGSTPVPTAWVYPRFRRCVEIFDAACDDLAATLRDLPEERLDEPLPWGDAHIPVWAVALRLAFHNGTHCGQLADLRRALGFRSVSARPSRARPAAPPGAGSPETDEPPDPPEEPPARLARPARRRQRAR
jgi:hypothetical protein